MKIRVNQDACVGCGACCAYEDLFEMEDSGVSKAKVEEVPADKEEEAKEAVSGCPIDAIIAE